MCMCRILARCCRRPALRAAGAYEAWEQLRNNCSGERGDVREIDRTIRAHLRAPFSRARRGCP